MANAAEQQARIAIFQSLMFRFARQVEAFFKIVDDSKGWSILPQNPSLMANIDITKAQAQATVQAARDAAATGLVNGRLATYDDIVTLVRNMDKAVTAYSNAVEKWNGELLSSKIAEARNAVITGLKDIVAGTGAGFSNFAKIIPYLPAIAIGIFVVPPILRLILAARRGGTDAALEYGAETGERIQRGVTKGAKTAATVAAKAALL